MITCRFKISLFVAAFTIFPATSWGWNLEAMFVYALQFKRDGTLEFVLSTTQPGSAPTVPEFVCDSGTDVWFNVEPCGSTDAQCLASVNRMASMLLGAKLAARRVHVQRSDCTVTEVALKPAT